MQRAAAELAAWFVNRGRSPGGWSNAGGALHADAKEGLKRFDARKATREPARL
jgi:hypothetical protein